MSLDFKFLGDCHNVAVALNRLTGLPICVLYGERHLDPIEDNDLEFVLIHVGVAFKGSFVDELGIQGPAESLLQEFIDNNEPYRETHIFEFESPEDSEFLSILRKTHAKLSPERIEFFTQWILSNPKQFKPIKKLIAFDH